MEDKEFTFLLEAYKTAVDYFDGYATRVYNRFNILLAIDVALAGVYGSALVESKIISSKGALLIPLIGLIVSLLLYIQSAQDKYVVKRHIKRINDIRKMIESKVGREDIPALFSPLDETDTGKRNFIFEGITSWRSNRISLTRVPPVTAIVFIVFWIIVMVVGP